MTLPSEFTAGGVSVPSYEIFAGAFAEKTFNRITVSAAVTAIGSYAFYNASVIGISFEDPTKCTEIASYAFAGCGAMYFNAEMTAEGTYLLNLEGFSSVGEYAFTETTRLRKVCVSESVTEIGQRAFAYSAVESIAFAPERTQALALASYAFAYMTSLQSVAIPSCLTELPQYLFRGCTRLADVSLAEGVESLGSYVFRDCSALTAVVLPKSLTDIAGTAFNSSGIRAYYFAGTEEEAEGISYPTAVRNALYCYSEEDPVNDGNYWHYDAENGISVWEMI